MGIQKILISNLVFAGVIGRKVLYHLCSGKVIECKEPFSSVTVAQGKAKEIKQQYLNYQIEGE